MRPRFGPYLANTSLVAASGVAYDSEGRRGKLKRLLETVVLPRQQRALKVLGVGILVAYHGLASSLQGQCEYDVTIIQAPECPPFGFQPTFGKGLNSAGELAGEYCVCICTSHQAFRWTAKTGLVELAEPPGTSTSHTSDINDMGWIVGSFDSEPLGMTLGFLQDGANFVNLGTLPGGTFSQALAINIQGQVVGYWGNVVIGPSPLAFLWQEGVMIDISSDFGTTKSRANDINDRGQATGWKGELLNADGNAFVWEDGVVTDLPVISGGYTSEGRAINSAGDVAGDGWVQDKIHGNVRRAFVWRDGEMINIGTLPAFPKSIALDINDGGQVVGASEDLTQRAFIWQDNVLTDLNELIPPDVNITMKVASAINNAGEISGWAENDIGDVVAVLLTPIPPLGDLDSDCQVGIVDFLMLLALWGPCTQPCPPNCVGDLDDDCSVGITDFLILLTNWG